MNITGQLHSITKDLASGELLITFSTKNIVGEEVNELKDKPLAIKVAAQKGKRSNSANAYMWALCEEISKKMVISYIEVYRKGIKDIGLFQDFVLQTKAVSTFNHIWEAYGTGWFTEEVYKLPKDFVVIRAYYGSSEYNTAQMSRLIKLLEEDAKALGITIISEKEKALLLDNYQKKWEEKQNVK